MRWCVFIRLSVAATAVALALFFKKMVCTVPLFSVGRGSPQGGPTSPFLATRVGKMPIILASNARATWGFKREEVYQTVDARFEFSDVLFWAKTIYPVCLVLILFWSSLMMKPCQSFLFLHVREKVVQG